MREYAAFRFKLILRTLEGGPTPQQVAAALSKAIDRFPGSGLHIEAAGLDGSATWIEAHEKAMRGAGRGWWVPTAAGDPNVGS